MIAGKEFVQDYLILPLLLSLGLSVFISAFMIFSDIISTRCSLKM